MDCLLLHADFVHVAGLMKTSKGSRRLATEGGSRLLQLLPWGLWRRLPGGQPAHSLYGMSPRHVIFFAAGGWGLSWTRCDRRNARDFLLFFRTYGLRG